MRRLEEKGTDEIFEAIMTENFPQVNVRHQTTDLGSSEGLGWMLHLKNYT